jgi:hypothetical protein
MEPTTKDLRLALDLVEFFYPLYKGADKRSKAILAKEIFHFDVPVERIERVAPFKQILHRRVIKGVKNVANGKAQVQITRVKRNHY